MAFANIIPISTNPRGLQFGKVYDVYWIDDTGTVLCALMLSGYDRDTDRYKGALTNRQNNSYLYFDWGSLEFEQKVQIIREAFNETPKAACECGAHKVRHALHSHWCPLGKK